MHPELPFNSLGNDKSNLWLFWRRQSCYNQSTWTTIILHASLSAGSSQSEAMLESDCPLASILTEKMFSNINPFSQITQTIGPTSIRYRSDTIDI